MAREYDAPAIRTPVWIAVSDQGEPTVRVGCRPCDLHGVRAVGIRQPDFLSDAGARRFERNPAAVRREAGRVVDKRRGRDRLRGARTLEAEDVDIGVVLTEDQPVS